MKIYLAGPIQHAENNGRGWRKNLELWYDDVEFLNPLDKYDAAEDYDDMRAEWDDEDVVEADLELIRESDGVLVHYEEGVPSYGTPCEAFYASRNLDKPVVAWAPASWVLDYELPTWLSVCKDDFHWNRFVAMDRLIDIVKTEQAVQAGIEAKREAFSRD